MYKLNIYPNESLAVCVYTGDVSVHEIEATSIEIASHPEYQDTLSIVSDFRQARVMYSKSELHRLSEGMAKSPLTVSSWCLLADSPAETAMALIFSHDLRDVHPVGVFCTIEAASEFVRRDLSRYLSENHRIRRALSPVFL